MKGGRHGARRHTPTLDTPTLCTLGAHQSRTTYMTMCITNNESVRVASIPFRNKDALQNQNMKESRNDNVDHYVRTDS